MIFYFLGLIIVNKGVLAQSDEDLGVQEVQVTEYS